VSITNSSSSSAVNGQGVISVTVTNGSIVVFIGLIMDSIAIDNNTNGAISLSGTMTSFSISNSSFTSIKKGNNGGILYLNITSYLNNENTFIQNSNFGNSSAIKGGAIYIAAGPIVMYNINFTQNTASSSGNDIFFNYSSSQSFYTIITFELCCSFSEQTRFSLSDGGDLDSLLPHCGSLQGERYVSSSNSYDQLNNCLNLNNPCRSISTALSRGVEAGDEVISVVVVGSHDDMGSSISAGVFVNIFGSSDGVQSLFVCLCCFFFFLN
jgi:hypothetical protein